MKTHLEYRRIFRFFMGVFETFKPGRGEERSGKGKGQVSGHEAPLFKRASESGNSKNRGGGKKKIRVQKSNRTYFSNILQKTGGLQGLERGGGEWARKTTK